MSPALSGGKAREPASTVLTSTVTVCPSTRSVPAVGSTLSTGPRISLPNETFDATLADGPRRRA
jgi:hypothetical protein